MEKRNSFVSRRTSISNERTMYRFSSKNMNEHPVIYYDDKHLYKDEINKKLVQLPVLINHLKKSIDINKSSSKGYKNTYPEAKSRYMEGVRPNYHQRLTEKMEKFNNLEKDFRYINTNLVVLSIIRLLDRLGLIHS
jgi:hypothetical protein